MLEEHDVRIDGDMLVSRAAILAEIEAALDGDESVEKAYWFSGLGRNGLPVAVPRVANARFRFASNVPTAWRDAVRFAASQWNKTTCINFTEEGSSGTLFEIGNAGTAATGNPAAASRAAEQDRSSRVSARKPRDHLHERRRENGYRRDAVVDAPRNGHVFGFKHPREGLHLAGTATSSAGCA